MKKMNDNKLLLEDQNLCMTMDFRFVCVGLDFDFHKGHYIKCVER